MQGNMGMLPPHMEKQRVASAITLLLCSLHIITTVGTWCRWDPDRCCGMHTVGLTRTNPEQVTFLSSSTGLNLPHPDRRRLHPHLLSLHQTVPGDPHMGRQLPRGAQDEASRGKEEEEREQSQCRAMIPIGARSAAPGVPGCPRSLTSPGEPQGLLV